MHKKTSILLLEDDANLGMILQEHLELNGFSVRLCVNGEEGIAAYRSGRHDLCLVDVMMPKRDGFSFARDVRAVDQRIPLIFLTAKSMKEDKIEGFRIGCDDYVTKPFSMEELLLRMEAVLKRSSGAPEHPAEPTMFALGNSRFDYATRTLTVKDRSHKLTTREADLLRLLCLHRNSTLERDVALRTLWGDDSYFNGRSMDVFISKLRKHLQSDPRISIMNVHAKGYKLIVR